MAEWIPIRKGLVNELEVVHLAILTGLDRYTIVGLLVDFWGWADSVTDTGRLCPVSVPDLSRVFPQIPGQFWDALLQVGWLTEVSNSVQIPNFDHWLGRNAKARLKEAHRKRRNRFPERNVTELSRQSRDKSGTTIQDNTKYSPSPSHEGARADFESFWKSYPRRINQPATLREWEKLNPSPELLAQILTAIDRQKRSPQWTEKNGRFIPSPLRWLRGRRWEDSCDFAPTPKPTETPEQRAARIQAERERRKAEEQNRVSPEVARSKLRGAIQPPKTPPQTHANDPSADESTGEGQDAV